MENVPSAAESVTSRSGPSSVTRAPGTGASFGPVTAPETVPPEGSAASPGI
jgi:hypothetical protein